MSHPLVKHWPVTATCIAWLIGAVAWAATVQSDIQYMKRDLSEIKTILTKTTHTAER